jgi:epoxyqueuosine reductase
MKDLCKQIRKAGLKLGFSHIGFTSAEPLTPARQIQWQRWREENRAGAMQYLMRDHPRRTHPTDLMPEVQTVMVCLAPYHDGDYPPVPDHEGLSETRGRIARYAWGRDYHRVLRERLESLAQWIQGECTRKKIHDQVTFRPCVDSAPIDERAFAVRAGLGFIGKNTLLLHPDHGSWFLIGILLTSLKLPVDQPVQNPAASCGSCRKCLDACPTGAFDDAYRLDPRKCISYLTIEQKDTIPDTFAGKLDDRVFGCDVCQEACPFNSEPLTRLMPELAADAGAGPYIRETDITDCESGGAFQRRYGETPLSRPGMKGMLKNFRAIRNVRPG